MPDSLPARPAGLLHWPTYALGQLYREAQATLEVSLHPEGLTLRDHFVLICVNEFDQISQQEVAERIHMDRSDLVKLLDRLEQHRLLVRERAPDDRRRHILTLTATGRDALQRANEIVAATTTIALSRLTPGERVTLHRLTLKALDEPAEIPAAPYPRASKDLPG